MRISPMGIPAGTVLTFAGANAPAGYLLCNGSTVSRSTYAALFAAIGTAHGSGDGATTFHLPDYRGRFLRGRDAAATRDPDRASRTASNAGGATGDNVGSVQAQSYKALSIDNNTAGNTGYTYGSATVPSGSWTSFHETSRGGSDGIYHNAVRFTHSTAESRPQNANVNYIIKV